MPDVADRPSLDRGPSLRCYVRAMGPVCSFCGAEPVVAWFDGPSFRHAVPSPGEVRGDEAWLACAVCAGLVEADDREELARRSARRASKRSGALPDDDLVAHMLGQHERSFWAARTA
jgi:hypothetical protein